MKAITRLNKELKMVNEELQELEDCIKKGWKTYLGDSIFLRNVSFKREKRRLEKEIETLNNQKA